MSGISGGEAVHRQLRACGAGAAFGVLGGSMLELYDSMLRDGTTRYVGARDERSAGHMADAYARVTGDPGILLAAQAGPGVANCVTPVAEAHLAYSPLVVVAGAISRSDQGKDTFQEIDQVPLFRPISKMSVMAEAPDELPAMVREAVRTAMSGRRGPAVLHVPRDLFSAEIDPSLIQPFELPLAKGPSAKDAAAAARMLASCERPVIVSGGGVKWAGASSDLTRLAECLEAPVVASVGHADTMRHGHPLYAGQIGPRGNRVANRLLREADTILALGTRLGFNSTLLAKDCVDQEARIIQIDIEPAAVGRYYPVALGMAADAGASARAILAELSGHSARRSGWTARFREELDSLSREREAEASDDAMPMLPTRAISEIRKALPENAIVALDTGNSCVQAADRLAHYQCPGLIAPLDFGLVGFGYAAAIGAQVAAAGRPVVAVLGDGGFGYAMAEVMTAVQYGLPVVAVVLDNKAWGAEKAYQMEYFGGRVFGADIDNPGFDRYAELCGAFGKRASAPGQLESALREALSSGRPAVLHADIDPSAIRPLRKDLFASPTSSA